MIRAFFFLQTIYAKILYMKIFYTLLVIFLLISTSPSFAQIGGGVNDTQLYSIDMPDSFDGSTRDSFYYMKDDGEFSDDEKDEEALYIFQQCNSNFVQRIYYDCACVSGMFRLERDKENLVPQGQIVSEIFTNENSPCANTIGIAGDSYNKCMDFVSVFNKREKPETNQQYCQCVANDFASDFSKKPSLNLRYIENMHVDLMAQCRRPS